MKVSIRFAKPIDAPDMAEILSRSWEVAYRDVIPLDYIKEKNDSRLALFKRIITEENDRQYVIQMNGKTIGIMCVAQPQKENVESSIDCDIDDSFYELHGLYLHPDYYHQGIGTKAVQYAFDIARNAGKETIIVWVLAENTNAIKFYEKCGFAFDGVTQNYNYGKEVKGIRLRRKLYLKKDYNEK